MPINMQGTSLGADFLNYQSILPEILTSLTGVVVMVVDSILGRDDAKSRLPGLAALGGTIAAIFATAGLWGAGFSGSFGKMIVTTPFRLSFSMVFLVVTLMTILIAMYWTKEEDLPSGEFFVLLMFATTGMQLMSAASDLVMIFLGLETVSITTYVLAGYRRKDLRSNESAMKYFILGSFSTAFLLYGIALTYGATKSTNLDAIHTALMTHSANSATLTSPYLLFIGAALMFIGFGFKIASAPFHLWTPDVYEGAPSPVTGFMAAGPKAAAFAGFLSVFVFALSTGDTSPANFDPKVTSSMMTHGWVTVMTVVAILTMTFGNIVAMVQTNIKRLLAYSSIAHAGYAMVGFIAGDWRAVAFYMMAYSLLTVGAFAIVTVLARKGDILTSIDDYAGIGFKSLGLSLTFALFMASLAGFPMTAGFMGKYLVFSAAWSKGFYPLVIVGVLNSAASVYYYLRPLVVMFFRDSDQPYEAPRMPNPIFIALVIAVVGTFYLGIVPNGVLSLLEQAGR